MTTMKLVIVGVFLALGGIQLADCIKCIWSQNSIATFSHYKSHSMKNVETNCPASITKCKVEYHPEGSTVTTGEVPLTYGCGACPRTKYCKDCTGDNCNKASVLNLINDLERDLVPCLIKKRFTRPIDGEAFCRQSEKCLKFVHTNHQSQAYTTIIGCENWMNSYYGNVTELEHYECRPNAEKTDCLTLRIYIPSATTTSGGAWHPNWPLVAVLLGCTMLIAILIALFIKFCLKMC